MKNNVVTPQVWARIRELTVKDIVELYDRVKSFKLKEDQPLLDALSKELVMRRRLNV